MTVLTPQRMPQLRVKAGCRIIPSSEAEPSISALFLFAFLAFPNSDEVHDRLMLFRAMQLHWHLRGVDQKMVRMFTQKKYSNILAKSLRRFTHRQSAARIAMHQILKLKREGSSPTLENQEGLERILLGWDPDTSNSGSTYKSKVWGRSRPVLHVAVALIWIRVMNKHANFGQIVSHLIACRSDFIAFIELAENMRVGLPATNRTYRLEQFIKFEFGPDHAADPIQDASESDSRLAKFRMPFKLFVSESEATLKRKSTSDNRSIFLKQYALD